MALILCVSACEEIHETESESEVWETDEEEAALTDETAQGPHVHTPWDGIRENEVEPTCEEAGQYDEVVYCSVCGEELSRINKTEAAYGHWYRDRKCVFCDADQPSEGLYFVSNGDGTCALVSAGSCVDTDVVVPRVSPDGDKVTSLDSFAFSGYGATSILIPDTVIRIGEGAFLGCEELVSVTLSKELRAIPRMAFKNCKSLKNVVIPDKVTFIGREAFFDCVAFEHIVIPAAVNTVEADAFRNFASCDEGTVKFENRKGWSCYNAEGEHVRSFDLSDEAKNCLYLSFMYNDCFWVRK